MTLILAIICKEGVVLASDGQATTQIDKKHVKSTSQKIVRLGKYWLGGCSGSAIDVQRLQTLSDLPDAITEPDLEIRLNNFAREVRQVSPTIIDPITQFPTQRCAEYLVVGYHEHPMIWHMVNNCQSVFHSKDIPEITDHTMFAIGHGSGQIAARAVFENLKEACPEYTLSQGVLIAFKLIKEAIKIDPYVGEPIAIWTVSNNKVEPKYDADLKELQILLNKWEDTERRLSQDFLSSVNSE